MTFPETFDEFAETYSFKDKEELYTNGSDLISVFRVKQWQCPLCHEVTRESIYWEKYKNDWIMRRYTPQYCSHCGAKFVIITNEDRHEIAEKLKQAKASC